MRHSSSRDPCGAAPRRRAARDGLQARLPGRLCPLLALQCRRRRDRNPVRAGIIAAIAAVAIVAAVTAADPMPTMPLRPLPSMRNHGLPAAAPHCFQNSGRLIAVASACRQFRVTQHFCTNKMGISDAALAGMPWPELLHRVVRLQRTVRLSLRDELREHDIVARITRKDDYLIGALPRSRSLRPA